MLFFSAAIYLKNERLKLKKATKYGNRRYLPTTPSVWYGTYSCMKIYFSGDLTDVNVGKFEARYIFSPEYTYLLS